MGGGEKGGEGRTRVKGRTSDHAQRINRETVCRVHGEKGAEQGAAHKSSVDYSSSCSQPNEDKEPDEGSPR